MANVDRKFPLPSFNSGGPNDRDRHEQVLDILSKISRRNPTMADYHHAKLTPQQERLIRKAMENCPLDVFGKIADKKS